MGEPGLGCLCFLRDCRHQQPKPKFGYKHSFNFIREQFWRSLEPEFTGPVELLHARSCLEDEAKKRVAWPRLFSAALLPCCLAGSSTPQPGSFFGRNRVTQLQTCQATYTLFVSGIGGSADCWNRGLLPSRFGSPLRRNLFYEVHGGERVSVPFGDTLGESPSKQPPWYHGSLCVESFVTCRDDRGTSCYKIGDGNPNGDELTF